MINDYPRMQRYSARQHTVALVMTVMRSSAIGFPIGYVPLHTITNASEVFLATSCSYALLSNQDRQIENWGVISAPGPQFSMCPSFDHASSLGRNELDTVRDRRLNSKDKNDNVEAYVGRATSAFYATPKASQPFSTIEAFEEGAKYAPRGVDYWLERLESTTVAQYEQILKRYPGFRNYNLGAQICIENARR